MFENLSTEERLSRMEDSMRKVVEQIRDELDDHLDTINQNTQELSNAYQYISELEGKVDKLSERLDEITYSGAAKELMGNIEIDLSLREQEVFSCLESFSHGVSLQKMTQVTGLTEDSLFTIMRQLSEKGVAVTRSESTNGVIFGLDQYFRDLQARKELVSVHPSISEQFKVNK